MAPGGELVVDIMVEDEATIDAIRAWVGDESARGSMKAKLDPEGGAWHGHLQIPSILPEDAALWVEIQVGEDRSRGRVEIGG